MILLCRISFTKHILGWTVSVIERYKQCDDFFVQPPFGGVQSGRSISCKVMPNHAGPKCAVSAIRLKDLVLTTQKSAPGTAHNPATNNLSKWRYHECPPTPSDDAITVTNRNAATGRYKYPTIARDFGFFSEFESICAA